MCEPLAALPPSQARQWNLQLVTTRSQDGGVEGIASAVINPKASIFMDLKGALSLETPAHHNGGLFPCWGCDFIWSKCLMMGRAWPLPGLRQQ